MADVSQSGSYPKLSKPVKPVKKAPWTKRIVSYWAKTWYFERLLVLLVLVITPFLTMNAYDEFVCGFTLNAEAGKIAQTLRQLKEQAHELNTFGTLEAQPVGASGQNSYQVIFDKEDTGVRQVALPKGISLVGSVRFDPQGVPERASVLKLRHGLTNVIVVVSNQGAISVP